MGKIGWLIISPILGLIAAHYLSLSVVSSVMAFIAGIFMTHSA